MMRHKGGMRQCRAGGDDLGATDIDAPVGFLDGVHAHVGALVNGTVPIHWRMNDSMVEEEHPLLCLLVPRASIVLIRCIKLSVCPQGAEQRPFVVRRASEPAV